MVSKTIEIHSQQSFLQKLGQINWGLCLLLMLLAGVGGLSLYSAGNGDFDKWASPHLFRFAAAFCGMLVIALIDIRWWQSLSYLAYIAGFALLIVVAVMGHVGMGAQRWINLGFMQLQPSELMKIAVIMALARYFHKAEAEDMRRIGFLIPAFIMIAVPVLLVMAQPDLGTSLMIVLGGIGVLFVAGAPLWLFIGGGIAGVASIPLAWMFVLHDYQKQRVMTFLHPETDPLGTGYHIMQSKIAIGSGGIEGKGFLQGTQTHLNFLPEKHTDFIFTLWVEEWGLFGGVVLLGLVALILAYCAWIASRCRHRYGRILVWGLMINFFLYVFVNIAMVMGLIPVVGAPLPLVSYGGTAMLAVLAGFGLIISANIYRDEKLPKI